MHNSGSRGNVKTPAPEVPTYETCRMLVRSLDVSDIPADVVSGNLKPWQVFVARFRKKDDREDPIEYTIGAINSHVNGCYDIYDIVTAMERHVAFHIRDSGERKDWIKLANYLREYERHKPIDKLLQTVLDAVDRFPKGGTFDMICASIPKVTRATIMSRLDVLNRRGHLIKRTMSIYKGIPVERGTPEAGNVESIKGPVWVSRKCWDLMVMQEKKKNNV